MKKLWVFYYTTKENKLTQVEVARKKFIKPDRSKIWKDLCKRIGYDAHQVGYVIAENFEIA